jgi:primosomal protein N' (replication factor Y)
MPTKRARNLRRNSTDAEHLLWFLLRDRRVAGCKFRRQHPIPPFTVDFACPERRLVIEADGGQHNGSAHDVRRGMMLRSLGWRVLRFWNNDILLRTEMVVQAIIDALQDGQVDIVEMKHSEIRSTPHPPR